MSIASGLLPRRRPNTHKGDCGRVLVIGGSRAYTGAAGLAAAGALRGGAGLVTAAVPECIHASLASAVLEATWHVLPETKEGSLSTLAVTGLVEAIEHADAVALGPGLSQNAQTKQLVLQLLPRVSKPLVLDADGLNAAAESPAVLRKRNTPLIVTPHPGEMARLARLSVEDIQADRERVALSFAQQYQAIVVLKGHRTVVAGYDGSVSVNETGNPGMASGGMGDVLTGLIAALLAQKLSPLDAARLGVYLHGLAGDIAARDVGEIGLIASDILDRIPLAIRQYQNAGVAQG